MRAPWRWAVLAVVVAGLLAVIGVRAWHDLTIARRELVAARASLARTASGQGTLSAAKPQEAAGRDVDDAISHVDRAQHAIKHSWGLTLARFIPGLARQRSGVVALVDDSRTGALAGRALIRRADALAARNHIEGGTVSLAALGELEVAARRAGEQIRPPVRSSRGLWGSLHSARQQFDTIAADVATRLLQGADGIRAARGFLGEKGDRHYLVALENNAEMRDQGAVLSYAVAHAVGGKITFEKTGRIDELALKGQAAPVSIPEGTAKVFGGIGPTHIWQSVNATADFPWSGGAMAAMYAQATGARVDGVIAIDVPGVAALLRATGPVKVADIPEVLDAGNLSRILLHDLYNGLSPGSNQGLRKERLADATDAVIHRLNSGSFDAIAIGRNLADAAGGGHLRLWSANREEEGSILRAGLGGSPATFTADRTFHLAVENRTATKLDYYVRPSMTQKLRLKPNGDLAVTTTVVVYDPAPAGPPSYQLGPDEFHTTKRPGDYIAWVLLWGPSGSTQVNAIPESALQLTQQIIPVAAGQQGQVEFETVIPDAVRDGRLELRLVPQPRLQPADVALTLDAPGWTVHGERSVAFKWDRVRVVSWAVAR